MSDPNQPAQPESPPQNSAPDQTNIPPAPPAPPYPNQAPPAIVYPSYQNPYPTQAAPGYAPNYVKKPLSVTALVTGIVGVTVWIIPLIGLFISFCAALVAIITGFLAGKREPQAPKGFRLTGIILGFVSMGFNLIVLIGSIALFSFGLF